jgi:hypothetical protein
MKNSSGRISGESLRNESLIRWNLLSRGLALPNPYYPEIVQAI